MKCLEALDWCLPISRLVDWHVLLTLGFEVVGLANVENFHKIEGATYWALGKLGSWQVTGYGERHDLTIFDAVARQFRSATHSDLGHPTRPVDLLLHSTYVLSIRYEYYGCASRYY